MRKTIRFPPRDLLYVSVGNQAGSALGSHLDRTLPEDTPGEELPSFSGETGDFDPSDSTP